MHFYVVKLKSIILGMLILGAIFVSSINFNGYSLCNVYFGDALRKVPIYSVKTNEKVVAISFDASWGADKTQSILELLKEYDARATFFLVGLWAKEYPDLVKKIDDYGNEIGTHSDTHKDMTKENEDVIRKEFRESINAIKNVTKKDVKLFRAPYGAYSNKVINIAEEFKLQTIQWDTDSLDWKGINAIEITTRIMNRVKNGSIILCHNNSAHIVEALPMILERLKFAGYKVKAVGDIILKKDFHVDHRGVQIANER